MTVLIILVPTSLPKTVSAYEFLLSECGTRHHAPDIFLLSPEPAPTPSCGFCVLQSGPSVKQRAPEVGSQVSASNVSSTQRLVGPELVLGHNGPRGQWSMIRRGGAGRGGAGPGLYVQPHGGGMEPSEPARSERSAAAAPSNLGRHKTDAPQGRHPFFPRSGEGQGLRNPPAGPRAAAASRDRPSADHCASGSDPGRGPGAAGEPEIGGRDGEGAGLRRASEGRGRETGGRDQNTGGGARTRRREGGSRNGCGGADVTGGGAGHEWGGQGMNGVGMRRPQGQRET